MCFFWKMSGSVLVSSEVLSVLFEPLAINYWFCKAITLFLKRFQKLSAPLPLICVEENQSWNSL